MIAVAAGRDVQQAGSWRAPVGALAAVAGAAGPGVVPAPLVPEWVVDRPAEVSHRRSLRRSGYWRRCKRNQS